MATFSFVLTYNFKLPTLLLVLREKKLSIHLIDIPCINVDCGSNQKESCLYNSPILLCTACYNMV